MVVIGGGAVSYERGDPVGGGGRASPEGPRVFAKALTERQRQTETDRDRQKDRQEEREREIAAPRKRCSYGRGTPPRNVYDSGVVTQGNCPGQSEHCNLVNCS
jgi:hypothetical protein